MNKNIVFTAPGIAALVEKPLPELTKGKVLIKSVRDTISAGTERANLIGDPNISPNAKGGVTFPRQCGYAISGVVEAVGEGVTTVKPGDRVACSWTKHASHNVLQESDVYLLPDEVSFESASLVHIVTFPLAAIRKCRLEIGESAMVMGQGILGQLAIKLLRIAGACPIIAVDPIEEKRKKAIELGADYALNPFDENFAATVKSLTNGGVKVCIEVTGIGSGLDMALDCMARFGRVALLGCTRNSDFTIDYYKKVHGPGITLVGAHTIARPENDSSSGWWTERDDAFCIINLIKNSRLDLSTFVEEVHLPEDAREVFARLANEKSFPIVQFDWSKTE